MKKHTHKLDANDRCYVCGQFFNFEEAEELRQIEAEEILRIAAQYQQEESYFEQERRTR